MIQHLSASSLSKCRETNIIFLTTFYYIYLSEKCFQSSNVSNGSHMDMGARGQAVEVHNRVKCYRPVDDRNNNNKKTSEKEKERARTLPIWLD